MIVLVDTQLLLWAAGEPKKLPRKARRVLEDSESQLLFSAASMWEVAIKRVPGRADFRVDSHRLRRGLIENGWRELAISGEHALATLDLPPIHKDPFDRIIVAQANTERVTLLTTDGIVAKYPGQVLRV